MTRANDLLLGKGENGLWSRSNSVTHAEEETQMEAKRVKQRRHCRQTDEARCRSAIRFRQSGLASVYHLTHLFLSHSLSLSLVRVHNRFDPKSTREESCVSSGTAPARRWGRGTSKLVQSYHEGRHVRDDLIIRDCSSAGSDGGAAGVMRGRGGWKEARICQGCRTRAQIYKADAVLRPHKVPLARWAPAHYTQT